MKKEYIPYYLSRAIFSAVFSLFVLGINWQAGFLAAVFFGLFLLYLHSGWFQIDMSTALVPLRRDSHGNLIQRKALIASVVVGLTIYLISTQLSGTLFQFVTFGNIGFPAAVVTYFLVQFVLFART